MEELDSVEKEFINEIIEKFCDPKFTNITDVTTENLRELLMPIFENYQKGNIDYDVFFSIHETLEKYITRISNPPDLENPDYLSGIKAIEYLRSSGCDATLSIHEASGKNAIVIFQKWPEFENSDYRSIGIEAMEYMSSTMSDFFMFPEDVPYFIEFLKTPLGKEVEAHQKIKEYVSKFDYTKRLQEAHERGYTCFINMQE
jgi:hypothetical protein